MNVLQKAAILFLSVFLLSSSCNKNQPTEPDTLPPLTKTGKNTFGCYVNGEPYVAGVKFTIGGPMAVGCTFNEQTKELICSGTREQDDGTLEKIRVYAFLSDGIGSYPMHAYGDWQYGYYNYNYIGEPCYNYKYNLNDLGKVIILHLDTESNIVSGIFEMDLINPDCPIDSIMHITDGRFDLTY